MKHLNSSGGPAARERRGRRMLGAAMAVSAGLAVLTGSTPYASGATATALGRLRLDISVPEPVLAGVASTYTITVTNTGTRSVAGIQIMNYLPAGLSLVSLLNPDVCARTNKPVIANTAFNCTGGTLRPAARRTVRFTAVAAQPFLLTDLARTRGSVGGTTVTNSVSLPIHVRPGPTDLQVTGSASTGAPPVGSSYSYAFQVRNNGRQVAYGAVLTDLLPPAAALVAVNTEAGSCRTSSAAVRCSLGALAVGRQVRVVITVVAPAAAQTLTDAAIVTMSGPDTRPANNQISVTVQSK